MQALMRSTVRSEGTLMGRKEENDFMCVESEIIGFQSSKIL